MYVFVYTEYILNGVQPFDYFVTFQIKLRRAPSAPHPPLDGPA